MLDRIDLDRPQLGPLHVPQLPRHHGMEKLERRQHQSLKVTRSSSSGGGGALFASAEAAGATGTAPTLPSAARQSLEPSCSSTFRSPTNRTTVSRGVRK